MPGRSMRSTSAASSTAAAEVLLDGDAGEVGDLLAQAGEAVEEGGLAGVGRADDGDDARRRCARGGWRAREGREAFRSAHDALAVSFPLAGRRWRQAAVSLRSATSVPSTR